jgi:hypothetical protein
MTTATWGFLLCRLKNIYSSTYRYSAVVQAGRIMPRQQNITSTALTLLSFGSADESQNISTAESPNRYAPLNQSFELYQQNKRRN